MGADGDPVATKTRKALAILGYVSRISDLSASREAVADLLWSSAAGRKGMQSLRQALKQLKTAEKTAGLDVVKSEGGHIHIAAGSLPTDLVHLLEHLNASDSPDFEAARVLWRGDYLAGFEDIDPVFTDWLLIERQRIRDEVIDATLKHLSGAIVAAATPGAEAAAHFLLHMDPAFEPAHRALIQIYLNRGQRERAEQQLRACERELNELDGVPEQGTRELLRIRSEIDNKPSSSMDSGLDKSAGRDGRKVSVSFQFGNGVGNDSVRLPSVSVIAGREETKKHLDGLHLEEEITAGLSAYRAFDLYQSEYFGSEEGPSLSMLQSDELGSYLLRFQHNERSGNVSIQFEDRNDGRIVFSEIVDPGKWDSIQVAASQIVNRIHLYSQVKLRRPNNNTVYGKWCQAENFMIEFNQRSDAKALELLSEIERQHSAFSMIYSARALIALKNLVYYAARDDAASLSIDEIRMLTERAVSLDAWQPINQRAHGWALIHAGMPDQASRAFLQAGRLNSVDPINMMSVAEGLAFSGNVGQALEYAENAMKIFSSVPRMFYEYYSHVYFAAEDYENANRMIERAAYNNLTGLTVRVAALIGGGREREAVDLLRRTRDTYGNKYLEDGTDRFMDRLNFFWEPKTRANYEKGVQMVKRFLLGDPTSVS
jgi:DNA-binding SARP family transcriptional activator/tetratricopeptide (TPR) repeat protein